MAVYVRDLYSPRIRTIDERRPLKIAAKMMNNIGISSLIVVSNGKAVGIITERDMMRSIMLDLVNLHKIPVKTFMSTNLITVKENALIEEAIELMISHKIKKLPVTSAIEDGEVLIGILSMTDIVTKFPELGSRFTELDARTAELTNFPYLEVPE
jgi:CBS domain-containing protein